MEAARPAGHDDLDVLVALAGVAAEALVPVRGGRLFLDREARADPVRPSLAAALDDPHQHLVVGTIDDVVVGYGAVRVEPLRSGERLAVVDDLYVLPDARGVGVGEAIMDDLIAFARHHRCTGIDALALPGDRATKNFFETFGLVARAIVVHRPLDP